MLILWITLFLTPFSHMALVTSLSYGPRSLPQVSPSSTGSKQSGARRSVFGPLFFIYTQSLGDNMQIHGLKYLLCADNPQMYIFSLDLSPEHQTHRSGCLTVTLGCVKHLNLDICQVKFFTSNPLTLPLKTKNKAKLCFSLPHFRKLSCCTCLCSDQKSSTCPWCLSSSVHIPSTDELCWLCHWACLTPSHSPRGPLWSKPLSTQRWLSPLPYWSPFPVQT